VRLLHIGHCVLFGKFTVKKKQESTINTRKRTNLEGKGKKHKDRTNVESQNNTPKAKGRKKHQPKYKFQARA
jgi:hypothetical protein